MKKALKIALLVLIMLLMILGIVSAICWMADISVTLMEMIKAILIAFVAVCAIGLSYTCIMWLMENIWEDWL